MPVENNFFNFFNQYSALNTGSTNENVTFGFKNGKLVQRDQKSSRIQRHFWKNDDAREDIAANNEVRQNFLNALKKTFACKSAKDLENILGSELKLSDFGLDENDNVKSGKPLTARRINRILSKVLTVSDARLQELSEVCPYEAAKLSDLITEQKDKIADDWKPVFEKGDIRLAGHEVSCIIFDLTEKIIDFKFNGEDEEVADARAIIKNSLVERGFLTKEKAGKFADDLFKKLPEDIIDRLGTLHDHSIAANRAVVYHNYINGTKTAGGEDLLRSSALFRFADKTLSDSDVMFLAQFCSDNETQPLVSELGKELAVKYGFPEEKVAKFTAAISTVNKSRSNKSVQYFIDDNAFFDVQHKDGDFLKLNMHRSNVDLTNIDADNVDFDDDFNSFALKELQEHIDTNISNPPESRTYTARNKSLQDVNRGWGIKVDDEVFNKTGAINGFTKDNFQGKFDKLMADHGIKGNMKIAVESLMNQELSTMFYLNYFNDPQKPTFINFLHSNSRSDSISVKTGKTDDGRQEVRISISTRYDKILALREHQNAITKNYDPTDANNRISFDSELVLTPGDNGKINVAISKNNVSLHLGEQLNEAEVNKMLSGNFDRQVKDISDRIDDYVTEKKLASDWRFTIGQMKAVRPDINLARNWLADENNIKSLKKEYLGTMDKHGLACFSDGRFDVWDRYLSGKISKAMEASPGYKSVKDAIDAFSAVRRAVWTRDRALASKLDGLKERLDKYTLTDADFSFFNQVLVEGGKDNQKIFDIVQKNLDKIS